MYGGVSAYDKFYCIAPRCGKQCKKKCHFPVNDDVYIFPTRKSSCANTQEAHRPWRNKSTLCSGGGGYPGREGGVPWPGGVPWLRGVPWPGGGILAGGGVPWPGGYPGRGVPWPGGVPWSEGYPGQGGTLAGGGYPGQGGYPSQVPPPPPPGAGQGSTPPHQPDEVPPPPPSWTDTQSENITSSRTTYAVGNDNIRKVCFSHEYLQYLQTSCRPSSTQISR